MKVFRHDVAFDANLTVLVYHLPCDSLSLFLRYPLSNKLGEHENCKFTHEHSASDLQSAWLTL